MARGWRRRAGARASRLEGGGGGGGMGRDRRWVGGLLAWTDREWRQEEILKNERKRDLGEKGVRTTGSEENF